MLQINEGLNIKQWSDWKRELLSTGTYDPNRYHELNSYQKKWTGDTLNALKAISVNEDYKID